MQELIKRFKEQNSFDKYQDYNNSIGMSIPLGVMKEMTLDFEVFLPHYGINLQREWVWTLQQQQAFILACLLRRQIPNLTIVRNDTIIKVIDGQHRLKTILEFVANKFPIVIENKEIYYKDAEMQLHREFDYVIKYNIFYEYFLEGKSQKEKDDFFIDLFRLCSFEGVPQDMSKIEMLTRLQNS